LYSRRDWSKWEVEMAYYTRMKIPIEISLMRLKKSITQEVTAPRKSEDIIKTMTVSTSAKQTKNKMDTNTAKARERMGSHMLRVRA
jgi:hypothetical protein